MKRSFSWWRALILAVAILLLRPSLVVAKVILYSPVGWVALWLVLIVGYLFLHPRSPADSRGVIAGKPRNNTEGR